MSRDKTIWPRKPDPRQGYFGARGHDPAYPLAWKYFVICPDVPALELPQLINGIVLPHVASPAHQEEFRWGNVIGVPSSYELHIEGRNANNLFGGGGSVRVKMAGARGSFPTIYAWVGETFMTWPVGGWVNTIVSLFNVNVPGDPPVDCLVERRQWDETDGPLVP